VILPAAAIVLALTVLPAGWGAALLGVVIIWEVVEKFLWIRYSRRLPIAVGREALVGLPVTAVSACLPEGRVRLDGESWKARCSDGAQAGDSLVVEDVDLITLIVVSPGTDRGHARLMAPTRYARSRAR
jgi:membrane protein implicated in regulation of membrane protease activity